MNWLRRPHWLWGRLPRVHLSCMRADFLILYGKVVSENCCDLKNWTYSGSISICGVTAYRLAEWSLRSRHACPESGRRGLRGDRHFLQFTLQLHPMSAQESSYSRMPEQLLCGKIKFGNLRGVILWLFKEEIFVFRLNP